MISSRDWLFGVCLCCSVALAGSAACDGSKDTPSEAAGSENERGGASGEPSTPEQSAAGDGSRPAQGGGSGEPAANSAGASGAGAQPSAGAGPGPTSGCGDGFDACGGDPRGQWTWLSTCQDGTMPIATCPEATFVASVTLDSPVTITSSSWTRDGAGSVESEIRAPRSCYEERECSEIYPGPRETEVVTEEDGVCVITEKATQPGQEYVDEISIGTNRFTDELGRDTEFCVRGNVLQLKTLDDNPFAFVHTFRRD